MALASSPRANTPASPIIRPTLARSCSIASRTPGYCTFTATRVPSCRRARMDLADRRGGERLPLEIPEDAWRRTAELALEDFLDKVVGHRRRVRLQRSQLRGHLIRQHAAISDRIWPTFITAPFMSPMVRVTSSAVRMTKRSRWPCGGRPRRGTCPPSAPRPSRQSRGAPGTPDSAAAHGAPVSHVRGRGSEGSPSKCATGWGSGAGAVPPGGATP